MVVKKRQVTVLTTVCVETETGTGTEKRNREIASGVLVIHDRGWERQVRVLFIFHFTMRKTGGTGTFRRAEPNCKRNERGHAGPQMDKFGGGKSSVKTSGRQ